MLKKLIWILFLASSTYWVMCSQDDAFIHLRYAEQLVRGGHWAYNTGEPSYGSSSPLFVFALAALIRLGLWTVWLPKLLSVLVHGVLVAQFLRLCRAHAEREPLLHVVTILLVMPMSIRWLSDGMETSLVALFAAWCGLLAVRPTGQTARPAVWFLLSVAACLTRVEFFGICALAIAIILATQPRAAAIRAASEIVAGAGVAVSVYLLLFGHLVPDTAIAKSAAFSFVRGIAGFGSALVAAATAHVSSTTFGGVLVLLLAAAARRAWSDRQITSPALAALAAFAAMIFLIAARQQAIQGVRYFVVVAFFLTPFLLGGKDRRPSRFAGFFSSPSVAAPASMLAIALLDAALLLPVVEGRSRTAIEFRRRQADIVTQAPCLAADIGYFTYYTGCRIYDMAGLVNGRHSASMDRATRLRAFADVQFELLFLNSEQAKEATDVLKIDLSQYRVVQGFDFPNIGAWFGGNRDTHLLFKKIVPVSPPILHEMDRTVARSDHPSQE